VTDNDSLSAFKEAVFNEPFVRDNGVASSGDYDNIVSYMGQLVLLKQIPTAGTPWNDVDIENVHDRLMLGLFQASSKSFPWLAGRSLCLLVDKLDSIEGIPEGQRAADEQSFYDRFLNQSLQINELVGVDVREVVVTNVDGRYAFSPCFPPSSED
jgi:hypothetical protein